MARPIWKGNVTFGLVNVPVVLYSAERRTDLSFRLIDSRNAARVRYERVNEVTGEEVPWDQIVKGYEYDDGNYVLLSDTEMEQASVEMTRMIEIEQFVDVSEIDVRYFERPYILLPSKSGEKAYVLLREAIAASGKAGIADVVIRSRQYLSAVIAHGDALVLELLRYQQELHDMEDFELPGHDLRKASVSKKEIDLATQLIDGMTTEWNPSEHHDEYREVLMKLIEKKIKTGKTEAVELPEEEPEQQPQTINFIDVLKQSVEKTAGGKKAKRGTPKKTTSASKRKTSKKRAS